MKMNSHKTFASISCQIATATAEEAGAVDSTTSTAVRCDLPTTATGTAIRTATEGDTAATVATGATATEIEGATDTETEAGTGEATTGATAIATTDGTVTTGGMIASTETGGIAQGRQVRLF